MRRRFMMIGNFVLAGMLLLGAVACGGDSAMSLMPTPELNTLLSGSSPAETDSPHLASGAMADATSTTGSMGELEIRSDMSAGGTAAPAYGGPASGDASPLNTGRIAPPSAYQSPLTAGQVDDNAKFDEYVQYLQESQSLPALHMNVAQRLFVRVLDSSQQPVAGARVQLFDGQRQVFDGLTVSDGRVLFFPGAAGADQVQEFRAMITRGNQQVEAKLRADVAEQTASIALPDNTGPVGLDIVFLMDATGSMNDEIEQLKSTVATIASRIEQLQGSSKPRLGLVAFRDRGDDYVTRSWDFTADVQQFQSNLANVQAGGGGDNPESVNAGLRDAIRLPGWSDNSSGRHLRMIVLVGDAPPHLDYGDDTKYTELLREAVAAGIKIFPIGASNLDSTGEYVFRQFAQVTQGQFIFLTYENGVSGAPGTSTQNHVSDFTVRNLDSLVVNLVAAEVANQTGQPVQGGSGVPISTLPLAPAPIGWLTRIDNMVQGVVDQLMNLNNAFWLALLLTVLFWARRTGERARVAVLPRPTPAELDMPSDLVEEDWVSREAETRWRVESGAELYGDSTVRVSPNTGVRLASVGTGEPTLPLGSLPLTYRNSAEWISIEEAKRRSASN
jgi:Mg-chelatase subunit ChlD